MITVTHNQVNHFTTVEQARAYDTAREVMSAVNETADIFRKADNTSSDRNADVGVVVLTDYKTDDSHYECQMCISGEATFDAKTGSMKTLRSAAHGEESGLQFDNYTCSFSSDDKEERYTALGGLTVLRDKATDTLYIYSPLG